MFLYYRKNIICQFENIHKLKANPNNFELCLIIQGKLIKTISYIERRVRKIRNEINVLRRELQKKRVGSDAKKKSRSIKKNIQINKSKISDYRELLVLYRSIGDSVAFIYLCKWDIKPFSFKEKSGFISGKKGASLEQKCLKNIFELGYVAILNDITHCLRYGDITIPTDGPPKIIEVKSGKLSPKDDIQLSKMKQVTDYLSNDYAEELYDQFLKVSRIESHSPDINHSHILSSLIERVYLEKTVCSKIEEGLWYLVATDIKQDVIDEMICSFKGCPGHVFLNPSKFSPINAYSPIVLSITNSKALYDYYIGNISISVFVDFEVINESFSKHGYDVKFYEDSEFALEISKNGTAIKSSRHFFGRIFYEFMSLDWFINEMIYRMENMASDYERDKN